MPWPAGHKTRTRDRIIRAAAEAFRARGVAGVRVEDVMAAAGLTHGGFYAHFSSKEELLGPALEQAGLETLERLSSAAAEVQPTDRLGAAIDAYLSSAHAAHPGAGCPVAALGPDVARSGSRSRARLARGIRERLAWMRGLFPGGARRDEDAVGALACMVGGIILARIASGEESNEILERCRRFLHRACETRAPAR